MTRQPDSLADTPEEAIKAVSEPGGDRHTPPRQLGVSALVMLIVAFNAPIAATAGFAQLSIGFGNGIGAPLSFLVAAAILFCFAAGFVGMSRFIADPGAFYQFIVVGIDKSWGLAGAFLAMSAYTLLCAGSYPYMGLVAIDAANRLTGHQIMSWDIWSMLFLAIITVICLFRIDLSMKLLGKLVCLEVLLVAIWQGAVLWKGGPEGYAPDAFMPASFFSGSPGLGVLFAMVCMIGIEAGACFAAETIDPEVTVGRATNISIIFLGIFYALIAWLYIVTQGASKAVASAVHDPVGSFFASVQIYLGSVFVDLFSITLVTSQMLAITSIQGSAARYFYALGRDGVLPPALARIHSKWGSPYAAVAIVTSFSFIILLITRLLGINPVSAYAALTGMAIYYLIPLLITTSAAVIVFFHKNPTNIVGIWPGIIAPSISTLALSVLFLESTINLKLLVGSQAAAVAAVVIALFVAISGWLLARFYKQYRPEIYDRIGNQ